MRFGFTLPRPDPRLGERGYQWMHEACALGEELGFDFAALGNHRFSPDALDPSAPFVVLSALAARTERLRFLTGVLILPLYSPLDVAEQVATLDQLSGGRMLLGVGIGYRPSEYEALGLSFRQRAARAEEALEVLYRAWDAEEVSFNGQHFDISGVPVRPRPLQRPRPPVWLGGQSRKAVRRAGRVADGWIAGYLEPIDALAPVVAEYREVAESSSRPPTLCLMRKVGIGEDRRQVEEGWLPGALDVFRHYRAAGGRWRGEETTLKLLDSQRDPSVAEVLEAGQFVAGDPSDCAEGVARCRALTGCEYFLASFGSGAVTMMDRDAVDELLRSMRLFAEEVMPRFEGIASE